ncbi:MAG: DEAD/DEAH box helicase [Deinococcota bacterium]
MFNSYPLPERVLAALDKRGIQTPTPIQAETLPLSLEGSDIIGQARTGTGKTLAFGLPIATRLDASKIKGRAPRAIVVTPTRELALQVAGELTWLASHLSVVAIYGGTGYGQQQRDLWRGCDVVVATPGRAIDYLNQSILNLTEAKIVVLDEADEMLSMGFKEDVERILSATPEERQTLVFSATLPSWAKRLVKNHTQAASHVDVMKGDALSYREITIDAPARVRAAILSDVVHVHGGEGAIVFTNTKAEVDGLRDKLAAQGHRIEALHGDMNQHQREDVLGRFRQGLVTVLVGTNVAARGLDIPQVDLVVHYRLPDDAASYQHRSGRTGRAGREGKVVSLVSGREMRQLTGLERSLARKFERQAPPAPSDVQDIKIQRALDQAQSQSAEDKALWAELARKLIDAQDQDTLAGLLAAFLGGVPAPRSLLTGEEGQTTLLLRGNIHSVGQVVRLLREAGASHVGRIQLSSEGAFVDVPTGQSDGLQVSGMQVSKATEPPKQDVQKPERNRRDRDGRNGGRHSSRGYHARGGRPNRSDNRYDGPRKSKRKYSKGPNRSAHAHD